MSDGVANAKRGRLRIFIKSPDYGDYCRDPELKKKPFPKLPSFKLCGYHLCFTGWPFQYAKVRAAIMPHLTAILGTSSSPPR
jgi:hypothetical protein